MSDNLIFTMFLNTSREVLPWIRQGCQGLPEGLHPSHYGETERVRFKDTNQLSNRERLDAFIARHLGGFFLYGRGGLVNTSLSDARDSEITFWTNSENTLAITHGKEILATLASLGGIWGFAAYWNEYHTRNGLIVHLLPKGRSEGWAGRDYRRYVPGLYWLNYFSNQYVETMRLDVNAVANSLGVPIVPGPDGMILQLYENPTDWEEHAERIGDVIHATPNMFSIRRLDIPQTMGHLEHHEWSTKMFREWP